MDRLKHDSVKIDVKIDMNKLIDVKTDTNRLGLRRVTSDINKLRYIGKQI